MTIHARPLGSGDAAGITALIGTCFGLQNGDEFDGTHVGFVFVAFFWRERSFRVLVSEFLEARLYTRVSTEIDELLGHLWGEAAPKGFEEARQHRCMLVGYLSHRRVSRVLGFLSAGHRR